MTEIFQVINWDYFQPLFWTYLYWVFQSPDRENHFPSTRPHRHLKAREREPHEEKCLESRAMMRAKQLHAEYSQEPPKRNKEQASTSTKRPPGWMAAL